MSSTHSGSERNFGRPPTSDTVIEEPNTPKILEEGTDNHDTITNQKAENPFLVSLSPEDPRHPYSWKPAYRWFLTIICGVLTLNSTFASAAPSGLMQEQMEHFEISRTVGTLLISLFVAGYCVGPLIWGPLSERIGRRIVFVGCFIPYTLMQMASALSPNIGSLLAFRFIGGMFASCPLSNSSAVMVDIWKPRDRALGLAIFSVAPFSGPSLAPVCSGFMSVAGVEWEWVYWLLCIFAGVCLVVISFVLPETYVPYIELQIAKKMRKESNEPRYFCKLEERKRTFFQTVASILLKPMRMFVQEPILVATTLYLSFVYGCLYLLFQAFPIIYMQVHDLNVGEQGLTFLALFVGGCIGVCITAFVFNPRYAKYIDEYAPKRVPPERRLESGLFGGPCMVISFFWIGWTAYDNISIWSPIVATVPLGLSFNFLFQGLLTYLGDTYLMHSASAMSINTVFRSACGAAFPLFATPMYEKLGVHWSSSLLGFIALLLAPIPWVFYKYGEKIRSFSKFSPDL